MMLHGNGCRYIRIGRRQAEQAERRLGQVTMLATEPGLDRSGRGDERSGANPRRAGINDRHRGCIA